MLHGIVDGVVDAEDDCRVELLTGCADEYLTRPRLQMLARSVPVPVLIGGVDDEPDAEVPPRELLRVGLVQHLDPLPRGDYGIALDLDGEGRLPVDAVILQQVT